MDSLTKLHAAISHYFLIGVFTPNYTKLFHSWLFASVMLSKDRHSRKSGVILVPISRPLQKSKPLIVYYNGPSIGQYTKGATDKSTLQSCVMFSGGGEISALSIMSVYQGCYRKVFIRYSGISRISQRGGRGAGGGGGRG